MGMARQHSALRVFFRWLLAALFLIAGVLHVIAPANFIRITPGWVPFPDAVIFLTGLAEIAGAMGLVIPPLRRAAGIGLALYALCVWPANFNHAWQDVAVHHNMMSLWYHIPRLPFQLVIIWWAIYAGGATDWPFRRR